VLDAGALIYSVDMGKDQTSGTLFLRQASDATGGRYFSARFSQHEGVATVLNAVLEDLRASYVVTYDLPSRHTGFHSLFAFCRLTTSTSHSIAETATTTNPAVTDGRPMIGDL